MTQTERHQKFAEIALHGLNLQEGQSLAIKMQPEHIEIVAVIADLAYQRGARYVDLWTESSHLLRSRIDRGSDESLEYVPGYRGLRNAEFIRDRWALLSLKSPVDPNVLDGVDAERSGRVSRAVSKVDATLRRALSADETQWCVMAPPAPAWGAHVFNEPDQEAALERLWDALVPILRLDKPDPSAFWGEYGKTLQDRARRLNEIGIASLHVMDDGTDLTIPLHSSAIWVGGGSMTQGGIPFSPNIPTEEVFTAPYAPGVTGRVAITRPVRVYGGLVRDAWFEFQDGAVQSYGAAEGRDLLTAYLSVDEGSKYMGEIALVDATSPIFQSGLVFENILLDENAACHFALGSAYPTCLKDGATITDEELTALGANRSRQHLDFMFGSDDISVSATGIDGETTPIIDEGKFVL